MEEINNIQEVNIETVRCLPYYERMIIKQRREKWLNEQRRRDKNELKAREYKINMFKHKWINRTIMQRYINIDKNFYIKYHESFDDEGNIKEYTTIEIKPEVEQHE
jgi:hypothetical protein